MSSGSKTCTGVAAPAPEQLCYIHCNFCNIVLSVNVPCGGLFDIVTVRCENCTNIWPLNMDMAAAFHHSLSGSSSTFQVPSSSHLRQGRSNHSGPNLRLDLGFSSDINKIPMTMRPRLPPVANEKEINHRPQKKKQRVPSFYNRFIREEIQRIKANNPDISHKEAFSTAAKNWAHFPHIQSERIQEDKHHQANLDEQTQGIRYPTPDKA